MSHCPSCRSADVVTFNMDLRGGPVEFAHCRSCEHRWWADATGSALRLPDVLAMASSGV